MVTRLSHCGVAVSKVLKYLVQVFQKSTPVRHYPLTNPHVLSTHLQRNPLSTMDAYTPPPSPPPRLVPLQRDRPRGRRTGSPRLKIPPRSFGERPSTPMARSPSPELIFSMSPIDSHISSASIPKTQLNPGALLARARQQSANAFAALTHQRPRTPLLYSFPKHAVHLRAPPTTGTTRAETQPARYRFSPISQSSDDTTQNSETAAPIAVPVPLPIPIPAPRHSGLFDLAQCSPGSLYSSDVEIDEVAHAAAGPHKIVGFDTGTDSETDSGGSCDASPFHFERFVPNKALNIGSHGGSQGPVRPLQNRNRG